MSESQGVFPACGSASSPKTGSVLTAAKKRQLQQTAGKMMKMVKTCPAALTAKTAGGTGRGQGTGHLHLLSCLLV